MKKNGTKNMVPVYLIKPGYPILFHNNKKTAQYLGINCSTLSKVLSRKQKCKKSLAYFITKVYNPEAEIEDYFDRI